ncbi:aspartyl/asparaginyl beta-hydroxylase domain-containing protein [Candidatus Kaiserbacteria bacterium]|nr:aspartyl/asparaginyl beta-hydroxylase domain-containing protein [Candidatus Kaiserbacteria bacterium]
MKAILEENKGALVHYKKLLETHRVNADSFSTEMLFLIDKYPFFFPPYLEILEQLESRNRLKEYDEFLILTRRVIMKALSKGLFPQILMNIDFFEVFSLEYILIRLTRRRHHKKIDFISGFKLFGLKHAVNKKYKNLQPKISGTFLRCVNPQVNVESILRELEDKEHYWFPFFKRQAYLTFHKHTQTICLRSLIEGKDKDKYKDNIHESIVTKLGTKFSETLKFVEDFAKEQNASLGRVVLVRLRPQKITYNHFDSEQYLIGRDRYHLVLHSPGEDILRSGTDYAFVKKGELWFFENKSLHISTNNSNNWRLHLIFDIKPL